MADIATIGIKFDSAGIRQAEKGLDDLAKQGGRTESSLNNSSASISRGFSSVQSAVALVGTAITALTAGALSKYADTATSVENQLRAVTNSTTELADAQARLGAIANQTRSGYESTVELYSKLSRSTTELNISQERLYRITETINKSFASSGATAIEADNAIRQLAQGLASGALRGDEFNSVAEQAPEILRAVAKETGMTIGELREFAAEGGITSELLIKSLENYQETVDRVYGKTSATISQSLTVANNNVIKYVENNEKLRSLAGVVGDAIIALSNKIDQMAAAASAVAAVVGVALVGSLLKSGAAFVSATAQSIAYQAALARMAGVSATAAAATTALGAATSFLLGPWGLLITALGAGAAAFAFAGDSAEEATGKMDEQAAAVSKLADKYTKLSSGNLAQTYADAQMQAIKLSERRLEIETRLTDLLGRSDGFAAQERNRLNAELRVTNEGLAKSELAIQAVNKVFEDGIPKADQMQTTVAKVAEKLQDSAKAAKELSKQMATLDEKMQDHYEGLEIIKEIETERIASAERQIEAQLAQTDSAVAGVEKVATLSEKAAERIESAFADAWMNAFDGMNSVVDGMKNAFKRMLAEMAHMSMTKPIMVSMGLGGMLPGAANAGGLGGLSSGLGLLGGLGGGLISAGGALGGAFGGGLAGAGGLLANGSFGAMFSGAGSLFGSGNIMAGLGMSMPIIAGAVVAALGINKLTGGGLFGTSFKQTGQDLGLSLGGGDISGQITTEESRKKSLFRGTKRRTSTSDFDASAIDAAFDQITAAIGSAANAFGIAGADEIIKGFAASVNINIKDKSEAEIQAAIEQWVSSTTDSLVSAVFGDSLAGLQKEGEGVVDTVNRLSLNMGAVSSIAKTLGLGFDLTGKSAMVAATNIVELAGGLDQLTALSSQYYQSFYSEAERQVKLQQQLAEEFAKLNTTVPTTRDQFRSMVDALDLTTAADQAKYAALMKLVPTMDSYLSAIEAQTNAAKQAADAAQKEAEAKAAALKASQSSLELRLMDALGQSSASLAMRRQMELEATDASLRGLLQSIFAAEDAALAQRELAAAQNTAADAARNAATAAKDAASNAFNKLQEAAGREKDRLKTELDLKLETIDKERSALEQQRDSVIAGYNEQSKAVEQYVNRLEGLNDVINGFLAETGAAVDPFKRLGEIFNEVKTGLLPDQSELQSVLKGISSAGSGGFGSAFEQQRAMAIARNQASGIGGAVGGKLAGAKSQLQLIQQQVTEASEYYDDQLAKLDTAAELAQKLHDEQVGKIDAQLASAQKQYNALMGIDDRILTMEQALNEFNSALATANELSLTVEMQQVEAINRVEAAVVGLGVQLIEMNRPEDKIWLPPVTPEPILSMDNAEMVALLKELVAASDATAKHTKKSADELELTRLEAEAV
jgi:tape measure domain-containing protein